MAHYKSTYATHDKIQPKTMVPLFMHDFSNFKVGNVCMECNEFFKITTAACM